ncbi:MAG: Na/Pi cotransporter family protein [Endozoicomonadaceae bacterium]|nr:Na/Pi cotransporter family protein [Endozoicomonadaceae bacterium]
MLQKLLLASIFILLTYGFWISPEFKIIAAGIAVFLFGMLCLEKGFKAFTGGMLKKLLNSMTRTRAGSFSFGLLSTTFLQSSSLVSVITLSFLSTELITLFQGIGIIFGANLGSTFGTWIIAALGIKINISTYAMPLLVFGILLQFKKNRQIKGCGFAILGMGFLILGIHYVKEGFTTFSHDGELFSIFNDNNNILFFVLTGTVLTVLIQSCHAFLVLIITALASGQLGYEAALAMCIGSNIGTTTTIFLGAINAGSDSKRLAIANLLFKMLPALIILPLLPLFILLNDELATLLGIALTDYTLKLALFHTLFSLLGALLLMPVLPLIVKTLQTLFISKEEGNTLPLSMPDGQIEHAIYLTEAAKNHPETALKALQQECAHLYHNTVTLICFGIYINGEQLLKSRDLVSLTNGRIPPWPNWSINKLYKRHIKSIYTDILDYSTAMEGELDQHQSAELFATKLACRNFIEAVKDLKHLNNNMACHIHSDNAFIREQYNRLRRRIAVTMKEIQIISDNPPEEAIASTDQLKLRLHQQDLLSSEELERLIQNDKVDSFVASSLINDNGYVHNICNSLIDGAVIVLLGGNLDIMHLDDSLQSPSFDSFDQPKPKKKSRSCFTFIKHTFLKHKC